MGREARVKGIRYNQWMESLDDLPIFGEVVEWDRAQAMQAIGGNLGLAAAVGSSTSTAPVYLAGGMFEVFGAAAVETVVNLSATANIIAALIGKYSHRGTNASTYMGAAIRGEIGDRTTAARAAFLAVMGGDLGTASAVAAFGVDWLNSTAASRFNFGVDLEGPAAHDSFMIPRYNQGFIRMGGRVQNAAGDLVTVNDIVILAGTAAPTDGTSGTGAGVAGAGSKYIRQAGASSNEFINQGTTASPTWVSVGTLT